jgi:hypothetical protein
MLQMISKFFYFKFNGYFSEFYLVIMSFCHLFQYCRTNTAVDIARILKVSTSPAGIKYKFGLQVPKGINNAIDLDKKNGNHSWQEDIKKELKQLKDYQTFIVVPQAAHQAQGTCFHMGLLRFTTPLCNYSHSPSMWDLQFSSASQLGASTRK